MSEETAVGFDIQKCKLRSGTRLERRAVTMLAKAFKALEPPRDLEKMGDVAADILDLLYDYGDAKNKDVDLIIDQFPLIKNPAIGGWMDGRPFEAWAKNQAGK